MLVFPPPRARPTAVQGRKGRLRTAAFKQILPAFLCERRSCSQGQKKGGISSNLKMFFPVLQQYGTESFEIISRHFYVQNKKGGKGEILLVVGLNLDVSTGKRRLRPHYGRGEVELCPCKVPEKGGKWEGREEREKSEHTSAHFPNNSSSYFSFCLSLLFDFALPVSSRLSALTHKRFVFASLAPTRIRPKAPRSMNGESVSFPSLFSPLRSVLSLALPSPSHQSRKIRSSRLTF